MVPTADNYGQTKPCPIGCLEKDEIRHVLNCLFLKIECPDILKNTDVKIDDAFSGDDIKMAKLSEVFKEAWRTREDILIKLPSNV